MKKLLTISLFTSSLLFGATIAQNNKTATEFLKTKEVTKALALLEEQYALNEYNNQTLFLLGTAAKESGEFKKAIKYFEELLTKDTGAHRVRLDLASIYYRLGNREKAKELLLIVQASRPPKQVGENIDSFLIAIEQGTPKQWNLSIGIGYMYDSNVNAGPVADTVLLYGLPFLLSSDAKQSADQATMYNLYGSYISHIKGFSWQSSVSLAVTDYKKFSTLDSYNLSVSTGLSKKNGKFIYSFPLILNTLKIGHKDRYYYNTIGIAPQVRYQVRNDLSFSATFSYQRKYYYQQALRDADTTRLSPSMRYFFDQSSFIDLGVSIGRERSGTTIFSNNSQSINANYYKAFSQQLNVQISPSYTKTDYEGIEVAHNLSRYDKMQYIRASLNYVFPTYGVNASLSYAYTKNNSNITLYDYKREQTTLSLTKNF